DEGGHIAGARGFLGCPGIAEGKLDRRHIPWRGGGIALALDKAGKIIRPPHAAGGLRTLAAVARRHIGGPLRTGSDRCRAGRRAAARAGAAPKPWSVSGHSRSSTTAVAARYGLLAKF